jgi:hypothetical protein
LEPYEVRNSLEGSVLRTHRENPANNCGLSLVDAQPLTAIGFNSFVAETAAASVEASQDVIMGLLERLRLRENVGILIVAHDLRIAEKADRSYEMRNGMLRPAEIPEELIQEFAFERQFGPSLFAPDLQPVALEEATEEANQLGSGFWVAAQRLLFAGGMIFLLVMLVDYGLAYYQNMRLAAERERRSALQIMALAGLRSDVQAVRDLGDGKYELTLYFWNVAGGKPIYVMSSGVQAYVQIGNA